MGLKVIVYGEKVIVYGEKVIVYGETSENPRPASLPDDYFPLKVIVYGVKGDNCIDDILLL